MELQELFRVSQDLRAHGGGNRPERQLKALLATLVVTHPLTDGDEREVEVMAPASEIVLLTDAPSHDSELEPDVISRAREKNVCISFFLSDFRPDMALYQRIADATGGTVIKSITRDAFRHFNSSHDYSQCARFYGIPVSEDRKKRQTSSSSTEQQCHHFNTSLFTTAVKATGHTSQHSGSVIVTKPNGERITVPSIYWVDAVFRDNPLSGEWSVCVSTGTLTITLENTDRMDNILQYLRPIASSGTFAIKYTPPPACE